MEGRRINPATILKILVFVAGGAVETLYLLFPSETVSLVELRLGVSSTTIVDWVIMGTAVLVGIGLVLVAVLTIWQHYGFQITRRKKTPAVPVASSPVVAESSLRLLPCLGADPSLPLLRQNSKNMRRSKKSNLYYVRRSSRKARSTLLLRHSH
jgi:hypothetical protein